ncbi:MAG TPA: hypothetical protein VMZ33_05940, partial [Candidatus Limnocylindrales bacterium]|nr:hypothetical protein [Candidatus Limnocylindrales bacterium]
EATFIARGAERAKSAAKGTDFEVVLEQLLGEVARATGDALENTASGAGDLMRSKKGDFVLTVDPQSCEGCDVRVVIEAKDRNMSWRELREELAAAKLNRSAQMAMVVFTPQHAPAGVAPFDVRSGHVLCVIDPEAPDVSTLAAALRLARLYAIASLERRADTIDVRRVSQAVAAVRGELDAVRALKTQLTAIGRTAAEVSTGLDRMRENVLSKVADAEAYLRVGAAGRD